MTKLQAIQISDEIISMYEKFGGNEYAGEKITQLEHMVQSAQLAEQQGFEEEVILAAFLHDIGHICVAAGIGNTMHGYGIKDHEEIGAAYLEEKGFSNRLIRLVESHVRAKRYLTYRYPEYYEQLSEASKITLGYQGGQMDVDEATIFESSPLFDLIIQMRYWDEEAKVEHLPVPELGKYRDMIMRHLEMRKEQ